MQRNLRIDIVSEVQLDVVGPRFLQVVSFREDDILLLELHGEFLADHGDDVMLLDSSEDLVSAPFRFDRDLLPMESLRYLVAVEIHIPGVLLLRLLLLHRIILLLLRDELGKSFRDEVILRLRMAYFDNLSLFSYSCDPLEHEHLKRFSHRSGYRKELKSSYPESRRSITARRSTRVRSCIRSAPSPG